MSSTGGSDGDGRGSRYQKELAANKQANERFKHGQSGNNQGERATIGGECLTSFGGCWFKAILISLALMLVLLVVKLGVRTIKNITDIGTIRQYSVSQYFRNIYHLDVNAKFSVNTNSINCYKSMSEALEMNNKPFMILKQGDKFIYRGYKNNDPKNTIVAIELILDEPVYCYIVHPGKWTGRSYWKVRPSKYIELFKDTEK